MGVTGPWVELQRAGDAVPADDEGPEMARYVGLPDASGHSNVLMAETRLMHALETDPLLCAALAIRFFLKGVSHREHLTRPLDVDRFDELTRAVEPVVAAAAVDLAAERIRDGFSDFRALVALMAQPAPPADETDASFHDRLDEVALFADELDADQRRAWIAERAAARVRDRRRGLHVVPETMRPS